MLLIVCIPWPGGKSCPDRQCAASVVAHAQTPTAPVPLVLDDMVVTAAGFEQRIEDAPASISVIDGEALRRKSYRDLGDAVRDVEGVTVNG
ncbi:hypothetical protein G3435_18070, partial [Pseudomonas sp. MAFF212428]|nr:hypothetical protein [Pseudomonas brassicae]